MVIFSDTRLTGRPTESTESTEIIAAQVALCIDSLTGPGAVVLNGDTVDLRECDHDDPAQALTISHSGTARRRVLSAA